VHGIELKKKWIKLEIKRKKSEHIEGEAYPYGREIP